MVQNTYFKHIMTPHHLLTDHSKSLKSISVANGLE